MRRRLLLPKIIKNSTPVFGKVMIAPGNLYYTEKAGFRIADNWYEHNSFGVSYGLVDGSSYFSMWDLGKYFDSKGDDYTSTYMTNNLSQTDQVNISFDNAKRVVYGGYDDWRMMTVNDQYPTFRPGMWESDSRSGSTVNGENKFVAAVNVLCGNENVPYKNTNTKLYGVQMQNYISGGIIFPDGKTITGANIESTAGMFPVINYSDLQEYINQGCAFIPYAGGYMAQDSRYWYSSQDLSEMYSASMGFCTISLTTYAYWDYSNIPGGLCYGSCTIDGIGLYIDYPRLYYSSFGDGALQDAPVWLVRDVDSTSNFNYLAIGDGNDNGYEMVDVGNNFDMSNLTNNPPILYYKNVAVNNISWAIETIDGTQYLTASGFPNVSKLLFEYSDRPSTVTVHNEGGGGGSINANSITLNGVWTGNSNGDIWPGETGSVLSLGSGFDINNVSNISIYDSNGTELIIMSVSYSEYMGLMATIDYTGNQDYYTLRVYNNFNSWSMM